MAKKQHLIYETSQVKALAVGRWPALLGLSAEILDRSQEHPCPKCGGTTRFRAFPDFDKTGAVFCNQCFNSRNGDGIAAYMWLNGCDFPTAVNALGDAIGAPKIAQKSKSKAKAKSAAGEDSDQEKGKAQEAGTGTVQGGCDSFRGRGVAKAEGCVKCREKTLLNLSLEAKELRSWRV